MSARVSERRIRNNRLRRRRQLRRHLIMCMLTFVLVISANNTDYPDEAYGIELPAYVREELIATLKGK